MGANIHAIATYGRNAAIAGVAYVNGVALRAHRLESTHLCAKCRETTKPVDSAPRAVFDRFGFPQAAMSMLGGSSPQRSWPRRPSPRRRIAIAPSASFA